MLQAYVFAASGLFLSYWFLKPFHVFALLVCLHLFVFQVEDPLEYRVMRPMAMIAGTALGYLAGHLIRKPEFVFFSRRYVLSCVTFLLWTTGTWVSWQIAPNKFWNYVFICVVPQLLSIIVSFVFIDHAASWDEGPRTQFVVHYQYFAIWVCLTLPYTIGQLVAPDLPTYYWTVIFFGAGLVWLMIHAFFITPPLPGTVTARALVFRSDDDGLLPDKRWTGTGTLVSH